MRAGKVACEVTRTSPAVGQCLLWRSVDGGPVAAQGCSDGGHGCDRELHLRQRRQAEV